MRRAGLIFLYVAVVVAFGLAIALAAFDGCYPCVGNVSGSEQVAAADSAAISVRRLRIAFIGDVMVHTPQIAAAKIDSGYNFNTSFKYVKPILDSADIVIANLETTLSENSPYTGYPQFRSPVQIADALKWAGADIAVLANNHSLDYGARGVRQTIRLLNERDIAHTGAFADSLDRLANNPLLFERNGVRIALLNYTYGTNGIPARDGVLVNGIDTLAMLDDIAATRNADCVVAYIHWGEEYSRKESVAQRRTAHFLRTHGVRVIMGSHPHVVQPCECSDSCVVVYSLGNFVSNQRARYRDGGIVATLDIEMHGDTASFATHLTPAWVRTPDYAVIPRGVGDTLPLDEWQRCAYEQFIADTDELLMLH